MSSGTSTQAANRVTTKFNVLVGPHYGRADLAIPIAALQNLALRELKFKKTSKQPQPNGNPLSDSPVTSTASATTYTLPAQSRDGTAVQSPYFSNAARNHPIGTILAPDSSPVAAMPPTSIGSDLTYKPHQSHFFSTGAPPGYQPPPLMKPHREVDPLSAPSGFQTLLSSVASSSGPSTNTSFTRPAEDDDDDDPGPPRKRINRGGSSYNHIAIESSPEPKKPLARATMSLPRDDSSDSDGMPDPISLLPSRPKSRVIRGRRPDAEKAETTESVELNRFIMTNPSYSRARIIAAFNVCDGDVKAATGLVFDPSWQPGESPSASAASPPPSSSVTPSASGSGSNQRAVEKEKGKKSMIYAKRQGLAASQVNVSPREPVEPVFDPVSSPLAPKPVKRKATRAIVASSGSEAEYSEDDGYDSDVKGGVFTQNREDEYYQGEAVKWFNDCGTEALVELAGESNIARPF
jgi:hypothetical protein